MGKIEQLAQKFAHVFYNQKWPGELSPKVSDLTIEQAYAVQSAVTAMRVKGGELVVGYKVGCTSQAIREQFGLTQPIYGRMYHPHVREAGCEVQLKDYVRCAIEPEMVLEIGERLTGQDLPDQRLIRAIRSVGAAIELHNYRFWFSPPSSQELICSGGIHAGLLVGHQSVAAETLTFEDELFTVNVNGKKISQAPASEIMGGPISSLRWLVNSLTAQGQILEEGSLVIPGSPVGLVTMEAGTHLQIEIANVGSAEAQFVA